MTTENLTTTENIQDNQSCFKRLFSQFLGVEGFRLKPSLPMTKRCDWMSSYRHRYLFSLTIPASHNSAAYTFKPCHPYYWIGKHWAKTQAYSIYDQLCFGIRFLDLRLKESKGVIWTSHTFLCVPLNIVLDDIRRFISENPTEIVIVFVVRAWKQPLNWHVCEKAFEESLGNSLIPYNMAKSKCMGDITEQNGKNIALISEGMSIAWSSSSTLEYYWPNVPYPSELKERLFALVQKKGKRNDGFFWMKAEVTPDRAFIMKHLVTSSLRDLAELCHSFILDMVKEDLRDDSCNIISTDFVHDWIIHAIINSNSCQ